MERKREAHRLQRLPPSLPSAPSVRDPSILPPALPLAPPPPPVGEVPPPPGGGGDDARREVAARRVQRGGGDAPPSPGPIDRRAASPRTWKINETNTTANLEKRGK